MTEQRDIQNINAISSQYMAGEQNTWNGVNGAIAATGSLGRAIGDTSSTTVLQQREYQKAIDTPNVQQQTFNPFQNIVPPTFQPIDFTTQGNMYNDRGIV